MGDANNVFATLRKRISILKKSYKKSKNGKRKKEGQASEQGQIYQQNVFARRFGHPCTKKPHGIGRQIRKIPSKGCGNNLVVSTPTKCARHGILYLLTWIYETFLSPSV